MVAVGPGEAHDEAPSTQAPEVVGHLVGGVAVAEQRPNESAQVAVAEAVELEAVAAQGGQQRHHPGVAEAQGCGPVAVL